MKWLKLFSALMRKYIELCPESNYLDTRILGVGGYQNIIHFYVEAENYIFYDNVYVIAFLDKDVETDIIPYSIYGNRDIIDLYNQNRSILFRYLRLRKSIRHGKMSIKSAIWSMFKYWNSG